MSTRYTADRKFWLVWSDPCGALHEQHKTLGNAVREAERLARSNPGQHFVVLEAMHGYSTTKPEPPLVVTTYESALSA